MGTSRNGGRTVRQRRRVRRLWKAYDCFVEAVFRMYLDELRSDTLDEDKCSGYQNAADLAEQGALQAIQIYEGGLYGER